MRARALQLFVIAVLVAAVACGDDDGGEAAGTTSTTAGGAPTATAAPAASEFCTADKVGGSIRYGQSRNAASLDPYDGGGGSSSGAMELAALYSALVRYNDDDGTFSGRVAESITANANATEWTMKLRPGVEFGNGDPLNAAMVKRSIDNYLAPDSTSRAKINATYIQSVDVVDPMTVLFRLKSPWGGFPALLSQDGGGLGMVRNMNLIESMGREAFAKNPVGGGVGPFEVVRYAPPEVIEFKGKADWWGGPVCIEELTFTVVPGAPATLDAFLNGELDLAFMIRDPVTIDKGVKEAANSKIQFENSGFMLLMNSGVVGSTPPTTDLRVRRAIAAALDPNIINNRAFSGTLKASTGIINSETSRLKQTEGPKFDPALAKRLIDEVKAEKGWDGSIRLIAAGNPQANAEAAITIKALLEAVGMKVDMNNALTIAQLVSTYSVEKNYDLAVFGLTTADATMWIGLRQWESPNADNLTGYRNPALDAALLELRAAKTLQETDTAMAKIQAIWNDDVPSVPFAPSPTGGFWQEHVKGVEFDGRLNPILDGMWTTER